LSQAEAISQAGKNQKLRSNPSSTETWVVIARRIATSATIAIKSRIWNRDLCENPSTILDEVDSTIGRPSRVAEQDHEPRITGRIAKVAC
jgi:hypothetical protein